MIWLIVAGSALSTAVLAWLAQGWLARGLARQRSTFARETQLRLSEFFLFIDPMQLWVANLALCVAAAALAWALTGSLWLALLAGGLATLVPRWLLGRLHHSRGRRFDGQLPDALLALAGALRAGTGVPGALRHIVVQAEAPLAQEFGLILREQRMGITFDQALAHLYERMPSESTGLVVSVLRIAAQTGGDLAVMLEGIASTLRTRLYLQARIHALTAQGRMQAWVVGSLPLLLAAVLDRLEPEAMSVLWHTPAGWATLGLLAALESSGVLWIRRIVRIEV